jgi:hypothetical protein
LRGGGRDGGKNRITSQLNINGRCSGHINLVSLIMAQYFPISGTRCCRDRSLLAYMYKSTRSPVGTQGTKLLIVQLSTTSIMISLLDPFLFLFPNPPFARLAISVVHLGPHLALLAFSLVLHRRRCRLGRCDKRLRALRTALRGGFSLLCKRHRGVPQG